MFIFAFYYSRIYLLNKEFEINHDERVILITTSFLFMTHILVMHAYQGNISSIFSSNSVSVRPVMSTIHTLRHRREKIMTTFMHESITIRIRLAVDNVKLLIYKSYILF